MRRGRSGTLGRFEGACALALALLGLAAAGCGTSGTTASSTYVAAGQIPQADRPGGGAHGAHVNAASVTVPLAKQNPTTALFSAVATFQSCLTTRGDVQRGAEPQGPELAHERPLVPQEPRTVRGPEQHSAGAQVRAERPGQPDTEPR